MALKFISLALIVMCVLCAMMIGYFIPERKYKNNQMARVKIIARVRVGCFLVMLVLVLICIILCLQAWCRMNLQVRSKTQ